MDLYCALLLYRISVDLKVMLSMNYNVTDRVTGCKIVRILIKLRLIGWVALHIRTKCIFWTCV